MSKPRPTLGQAITTPQKPIEATPGPPFDPLVSEMRRILANHPDACEETKHLIEQAIHAQQGGLRFGMSLHQITSAVTPAVTSGKLGKAGTL